MTEQEYADIAAACDRLLRAPGTSLARLAIPALHFLNEHPSILRQYTPVLTGHHAAGQFGVARALLRAARGITRSAVRQPARQTYAPADVLIVSHLLKAEQLRQDSDFYFGDLQSYLKDQGASSLLVLIDHARIGRSRPEMRLSSHPRAVLPTTVALTQEADIWRQCVAAWRHLRQDAVAGNSTYRRLALLASHSALAGLTVANLRMHSAIAAICQVANPKIVITTYEGTVIERLVWHAARTARRRPLCVGYQHAMILERAHAIRRPVAAPGIDCDPDVILTLGAVPHAALASSLELQSARFIEYGSHRRPRRPALPAPHTRPHCCLVLPDASHEECVTLFDFALRCARINPSISFILRPHPMANTGLLLRRLPVLASLPVNVTLSIDTALEQDLAQARYCLYRGSSAALHAVRAGIRPFYLARPDELPFDCLYALGDWRERVTTSEELLGQIRGADSSPYCAASAKAADICERYVAPIRLEAVRELLALVSS